MTMGAWIPHTTGEMPEGLAESSLVEVVYRGGAARLGTARSWDWGECDTYTITKFRTRADHPIYQKQELPSLAAYEAAFSTGEFNPKAAKASAKFTRDETSPMCTDHARLIETYEPWWLKPSKAEQIVSTIEAHTDRQEQVDEVERLLKSYGVET